MNSLCETDWQLLLTEAERGRMLQDIAQVSLAVGRHLFADHAWDDLDITAGSLLTHKSPIERLGFIARILPALTATVEQIVQVPLVDPVAQSRRAAPPERAHRLQTSALLQAVQRGHAARWVTETRTGLSADTTEHQAVRAFLRILQRDAIAIEKMAEAAEDTEIAKTAAQCATRLSGLRIRLGREEDGSDTGLAWAAPPTHRMLAHPAYARVAGWMRRYRQSFGFEWDTPLFTLPGRETWRLYEAWGLFQTLQAFLTLGYRPSDGDADRDMAQALFAVKQDRLMFRLMKGEESRVALRSPQGTSVALFYNRSYPARQRSLSRTMQPDITLEDARGRTWVLDPKFKAYAAPGEEGGDIDQMHAYRDAIVDRNGHKPIQRAWCLYAGLANGVSRPLISYGPPAASVVGALCLRPGSADGFTRLCSLLSAWGY